MSAAIVWLGPDELLLQRRSPTSAHGAGCLELPGGKVELGEAPTAALRRELVEEWGPLAGQLVVGPIAEVVHHVYVPPAPEILLCVYHVDGRELVRTKAAADGDPAWGSLLQLELGAEVEALRLHALPVEQFLEADRPMVLALRDGRIPCPWERS